MEVPTKIQEMIEQIEDIYKERTESNVQSLSKTLIQLSTIQAESFELPPYSELKQILQMIRILHKEKKHQFK